MLSSLILAASLVTQVPTLPRSAGYAQGVGPSAKQRKLNAQKWDPKRTKYAAWNVKQKTPYTLRLTPQEAVWFMFSHPNMYRRNPR